MIKTDFLHHRDFFLRRFLSILASYSFFFLPDQDKRGSLSETLEPLLNLSVSFLSPFEWNEIKLCLSLIETYLLVPLNLDSLLYTLFSLISKINKILFFLESNQYPPESHLNPFQSLFQSFVQDLILFFSSSPSPSFNVSCHLIIGYSSMLSPHVMDRMCPPLPLSIQKNKHLLPYPCISDPINYICCFLSPSLPLLLYQTQSSLLFQPSPTPPTFCIVYTYLLNNIIFYIGNIEQKKNLSFNR